MSTFGLRRFHKYKVFYAAIDLITIFICFLFSAYINRIEKQLTFFQFYSFNGSLIYLLLGLSVIFIFIFQYNGLYRINIITTRAAHFTNIIKSQYYGALNIVLVSILIQSWDIIDAKLIIFTYFIIAVPALYVMRVELMRRLFILLRNNSFKRKVIIVGDGKSGKLLAAKLMLENYIGIEIAGFVDDDKEIGEEVVKDKRVIGKLTDLRNVITDYNIDEIIVAIDEEDLEKLSSLLDYCKLHKISVRITSELLEIVTKRVETEKYLDIPVIDVSASYNNSITLGIKRLLDLSLSFVAILIFSPIMILIAVLIKLSSRGPVFYTQDRIGRYGKPFKFYKFRSTKVQGGEDEEHRERQIEFIMNCCSGTAGYKIMNKNRLPWIGRLLRKTSLDELPQLFNVLKGEMSLVGPRPCHPDEYENYNEWQKKRLSAVPGCIGVWQLFGKSGISFKDSMVLDLYYINNMSPWFDLQLIFKTIPRMFFSGWSK